jgi:STAM-binding protein
MSGNPPIDPKVLLDRAKMYETKYPVKLLIKSASGILRNAKVYDREGAREDAFILYSRFVDLIANRVASSPELKASKQAYKTDSKGASGELYLNFARLLPSLAFAMERSEFIMNEMKMEYDEYKKLENSRQEIRELQKRKFLEKKEREEREKLERRRNIERRKSSMHSDDRELLKKLRSLSDSSFTEIDNNVSLRLPAYPTLNEIAITDDDNYSNHSQLASKLPSYSTMVKTRPPSFSTPSSAMNNLTKSLQTSKISQNTNHKIVNYNEGGGPLRTMFLPAELSQKFTEIAEPNTKKNLETCGILVGKLNRNAFFITHLLIPEQDSTSDTCSTKNEEKMFDYIDNEDPDLFILGWIHTHPTQSCFLSSVDLHTHNSYQIMLNEAIAIVCSPSDKFSKKLGVFRLTDPPGVPTITDCSRSGFHPHEEPNLYVDCNRISNKQATSGHVVIKVGLSFKIKDLR